jgi:hypothetical protein
LRPVGRADDRMVVPNEQVTRAKHMSSPRRVQPSDPISLAGGGSAYRSCLAEPTAALGTADRGLIVHNSERANAGRR